MNPLPAIENISLSQIDFDDYTYSISPEPEIIVDETLRKSIAANGILHPPIVRESHQGVYAIISGRKRLLVLRAHQTAGRCNCLVIARRTPEAGVFNVLLEEIQLTRQLTTLEKAIFLQKITAVVDERQIIEEFLPRLDHAPNPAAMKQTLRLLDLEDFILRAIHHGYVHETVAREFTALTAADRAALFEIIATLRLSFSNQKKLLAICRELAGRDNTSIAALLDNDEVRDIVQHREANPPQKTKNLMAWLARRHMPRSGQAEEEFRRFLAALQLPENISVTHTPFFENDALTLAITFDNRKSLQRAWEKIKHATRHSDN